MKDCSTCGNYLPFTDFYVKKNSRIGYQSACKDCHREGKRAWRANNREKCRDWDRKRKYSPEARARRLKIGRERNKFYRDNLSDCYVANLIAKGSDLKPSEIPKELIELTRLNLQLKRQLGLTSGSYKRRKDECKD